MSKFWMTQQWMSFAAMMLFAIEGSGWTWVPPAVWFCLAGFMFGRAAEKDDKRPTAINWILGGDR